MARERAIGLPVVSKFDDRGIRDAKTGLDRLAVLRRVPGRFLLARLPAWRLVPVRSPHHR